MSEAAEEEVEQPHTEGSEHVEYLADKMATFMRERGREKEGENGGREGHGRGGEEGSGYERGREVGRGDEKGGRERRCCDVHLLPPSPSLVHKLLGKLCLQDTCSRWLGK